MYKPLQFSCPTQIAQYNEQKKNEQKIKYQIVCVVLDDPQK